MGWVRIDDSFYDHPKLIGLDACEIGLWVIMLAWSNRYMTDGCLPAAAVKRFQHDQEPSRLVAAGLWKETEHGFEIHDYLEYQPSSEKLKDRREKDKERKARSEVDPASGAVSNSDAIPSSIRDDSARNPSGSPPDSEVPQAPAPSPDDSLRSSSRRSSNGRSKAKRIPDPFDITTEMIEWASSEIPGFDWKRESQRFLDYYRAAPDAKGLKKDWPATWRNWMRNNAEGKFAR